MRSRVPIQVRAHGLAALAGVAALFVALTRPFAAVPLAQTDLDTFMQQVLAERDSNWKKLQQYVLDEREQIDLRGPSGAPLWGERRDYTWYIRDGFFVRSPVRVNGAVVGEPDRIKYESEFLERQRQREARAQASGAPVPDRVPGASTGDVDGLIRQSRQPEFISSAYFLRFKFDAGRYALVGREQFDGQEALRIEYYPEKLFTEERREELREEYAGDRRRPPARDSDAEKSYDAELRRLMNKSSKVTLWIAPASHQILKYTFDDLGWNFFPAQWLAQLDGVAASMTMAQPFPDVWLPRGVDMNIRLLLAFGNVEMRYSLQYENYRQADVQTKVGIPGRP